MSKINRRLFMLTAPLALAALSAGQAHAQAIPLNELSRYFNQDLVTGTGDFTQVNADGTISTGTIFIKRPGRIRFEYAPPSPSLVMASGGQVAVFDPQSNSGVDRYPLSETPLSIILERNVNLGQRNMVTGHSSDGSTTTVTAQDPAHPEYGNIQLVFTANPTELRQWIVTDDTGSQTTVILGDLAKGGNIPDRRFNILAEMRDRGVE